MIFMGYVRPDKVGGIINTLKYKGLTVRIVMDWAMGHVIDNGFKGQIMGSSRNNNNAIKDAMTNSGRVRMMERNILNIQFKVITIINIEII